MWENCNKLCFYKFSVIQIHFLTSESGLIVIAGTWRLGIHHPRNSLRETPHLEQTAFTSLYSFSVRTCFENKFSVKSKLFPYAWVRSDCDGSYQNTDYTHHPRNILRETSNLEHIVFTSLYGFRVRKCFKNKFSVKPKPFPDARVRSDRDASYKMTDWEITLKYLTRDTGSWTYCVYIITWVSC